MPLYGSTVSSIGSSLYATQSFVMIHTCRDKTMKLYALVVEIYCATPNREPSEKK